MQRRQLLHSALASATLAATGLASGLFAWPRRTWALGGALPPLDQPAPDFSLAGVAPGPGGQATETKLALADFAGQWLVLYFYPKDFTGGCTLEARGFQRLLSDFQVAGSAVVGISADDAESHASFCSSEGLAFPLLSDPGGMVSRRYGSWLPPFSQRHTFLIDPDGQLRRSWTAVRPAGHASEVLDALRDLKAGAG